ncbi:hypothetical protein [Edaphobacter aggregans]|uniref:hypothetical protein n=1 Tax=Edaphobacter aggregans TaxID=570835 RepID=UPI000F74619E|nr:hypothetical protein [Edaphobacter aggregans]
MKNTLTGGGGVARVIVPMRAAASLLLLLSFPQIIYAQSHTAVAPKLVRLRNAKLPAKIRDDISTVLIEDMKGSGQDDADKLRELALNSTVSFLRLEEHGPDAILVDGTSDNPLSGANGVNSPSWLFKRVGGGVVLLMENVGVGISAEPTSHHGMHDVSSAIRMGHTMDVVIEVDEFDGNTYKPAYCYELSTDDDGKDKKSARHPC